MNMIIPKPEAAPKDREIVSSRRMKELDKAMSALCGPETKELEVSGWSLSDVGPVMVPELTN